MLDDPDPDWHRLRQMERNIRWLDLVSFEVMADWYAMVPGSLSRDDGRREQACRDLLDAASRGEFGPPDRPTLAYLSPAAMHESWRSRVRIQPAQARVLAPSVVFTTKTLAAQWFTTRQLPLPPWLIGASVARKPIQTIEGRVATPDLILPAPKQPPPSVAPAQLVPRSKTGPKGGATRRATESMLAALQSGEATVDNLASMKRESLGAIYGVGKTAAKTALDDAASQLAAITTPAISGKQ
jgi:hypothetical protein